MNDNKCKQCGKQKTDKKWIRTHFCSQECWNEYAKENPAHRPYKTGNTIGSYQF